MTKTKFDRWLIENFVYEHHIRVVHLPEFLPRGVTVTKLKTQNYHYLLVIKNKNRAEKLIQQLTDQGSMFSTKINAGSHWYNRLIFNKKKSFSFSVFWWIVLLSVGIFLSLKVREFMQTELYSELKDHTIKLLNQ